MERLNETTVVVDNFLDFKNALVEEHAVTLVYLANNIELAEPVSIFPDRNEITIDGKYPPDTGSRCTLTDFFSKNDKHALGIHSPSNISMTVQNLMIIGHNYHGILHVPAGWDYRNVTVTYRNVKYTGPQMTYNPNGLTRYFDVDFISAEGASARQEVGEVSRVEMGGRINITHASPYEVAQNKPVFTFWGYMDNDSLTILPGAKVTIRTENSFMACRTEARQAALEVRAGATLDIESHDTICHKLDDVFSSITVRENADVLITQSRSNDVLPNHVPTINCGAFSVERGAQVRIVANFDVRRPLIRFVSGSSLSLNEPERFVVYSRNVDAISFLANTPLLIRGGQVNRWRVAKVPFEAAGGLDDIPPLSWRKPDGSVAYIKATVDNYGRPTIEESSFTLEELAYFRFDFTQVFSVGELPVTLDPIVAGGRPITGTTAPQAAIYANYTSETLREIWGGADASGRFSLNTPAPIPEGAQVSVMSNLDFLYSEVKDTARSPGTLELVFAPEYIPYLAEKISTNPILYGRKAPDFHVTVADTRVYSDVWYLYCVLKEPVTGEKNDRPAPCFLVFADPQGALHTLGEARILVYTGAKDEAKPTKEISWTANRGLLMQATGAPFFNKEEYKAKVTWTLSDTPLPE